MVDSYTAGYLVIPGWTGKVLRKVGSRKEVDMFNVNQNVLVQVDWRVSNRSMSFLDEKVWERGVVVERRVPICNHRPFTIFFQELVNEQDCLVCVALGNHPQYDVSLVHNSKSYLAKNVRPGNLRAAT